MTVSVYALSGIAGFSLDAHVEQICHEWRRRGRSVVLWHPFRAAEAVAAAARPGDMGMRALMAQYDDVAAAHDVVVVVGSDGTSPYAAVEFGMNAELAANLGAPLVLVAADETAAALVEAAEAKYATVGAVVSPELSPACGVVSGGSSDEVLQGLHDGCVVVLDARTDEIVLALAVAGFSGRARPSSIVVCGTLEAPWAALLHGAFPDVTVSSASVPRASVATAMRQAMQSQRLNPSLFGDGVIPVATTPLRFERALQTRARATRQRVVLPEGTEPRVVEAAARILAADVCAITLLGNPDEVRATSARVGVDISSAEIVDPSTHSLRASFARRYAELRAAKGVTYEQAFERVADVSYFGTMLVHEGHAGGMVSGAAHTTAHTIRPSFEVIKTRPGVAVVSSVFFMCVGDRVLVFGDCAVNPNPTAAQLADIAISSAETARQFGIEPRVAMLSYSTGESGTGPDVDLVTEATALVGQRSPKLVVDGPLQFDAAVDPTVGASKRPGSAVAGRANVLIFPDLSAGNAAYKAVQRTAHALAIGPVLQGLNKPVNDLSRGALVDDIVNTIAITAIQAGEGR